jgi:hypothetical protein
MAVNLYRKHPELDHVAQVRFLAKPLEAVDQLLASSFPHTHLVDTVAQADGLLRRTAAAIDDAAHESPLPGPRRVTPDVLRHDVWFVVFSAARIRGKIRALVGDADGVRLAAAQSLLAGMRELDFIVRAERQLAGIAEPSDAALLPSLTAQAVLLNREAEAIGASLLKTTPIQRWFRRLATQRDVSRALRSLDVSIEHRLERRSLTRTLAHYRELRGALKRRMS